TNIFSLIICLMLLGTVYAQGGDKEETVKLRDLPQAVQNTVKEKSKGATLKRVSKETENGKTQYEAEMIVDGHSKDLLIDSEGNVVEIEEQVKLSSLPEEVQAGIKENAGKGKILKVESVTKGSNVIYEALIATGGKRSEIAVGTDGKLIPKEK